MNRVRILSLRPGCNHMDLTTELYISGESARRQLWSQKHGGEMPKLVPIGPRYR